jgi:hypothetical protein
MTVERAATMNRKLGSPQILQAYAFLVEAENNQRVFTFADLVTGSGWAVNTAKSNLAKKLPQLVLPVKGGYRAEGVRAMTADAFCRICSQSAALSRDPLRPTLTLRAEGLVIKAREAALAAVQHYNNPTAVFRSGNYIILMMIAFTALFHAIYERDSVDYEEKTADGSSRIRNGQTMFWDAKYAAHYYAETHCSRGDKRMLRAMAKNLEFFVPIRNKIEHQFMPPLDETVAGECQAMLMNFETILAEEFTSYYSLNQSLTLAMQFSTRRTPETINSLRRMQSQEYDALKEYINNFRAGLSDELFGNLAFAFRVLLIPMPVSEARKSDYSIEFVKFDPSNPEQTDELERYYVAIKQTVGIGDPAKDCTLWESEVVVAVAAKIGTQVTFGTNQKNLNGSMIRDIVKAHNIISPSRKYYRPGKAGSRAQYGQEFVDWIIDEYQKDTQFFHKTRLAVLPKITD